MESQSGTLPMNKKQEEKNPRKEIITFPHVNDEDGWFYYCFPGNKADQQDHSDPTHMHCRKPLLSHLLQLDYVSSPQYYNK